jgi:hypothetical protein
VPWYGSVKPKPPIFSRRAIAGRKRCFCSSEPSSAIDIIARADCTPMKVAMLRSPRASSMMARPAETLLMPEQP